MIAAPIHANRRGRLSPFKGDGHVTATTDALGRVAASSYNAVGQAVAGYQGQVLETTASSPSAWTFSGLTPNCRRSNTIAYSYDADGELLTAQDTYASPNAGESSGYTYAYNSLGEEISVDNNAAGTTGTPGVPDVVLSSSYDADGAPEVSGLSGQSRKVRETLMTMLPDLGRLVGHVARGYVDEVCDSSARQLPRQRETRAMLCSLGSLAS